MAHHWTAWKYDRARRRWVRRCRIGRGHCTAAESVPRGHRPKGGK